MIKSNLYIGSRYPVKRKKLRETVKRVLKNHGIDNARLTFPSLAVAKLSNSMRKNSVILGQLTSYLFLSMTRISSKMFHFLKN